MNEENTQKLLDEFPMLYREKNPLYINIDMPMSFDVGDGWFNIIYELSQKMQLLVLDDDDWCVVQVKEKFGGLRYYCHYTTDKMDDVIQEAESKSFTICEECGNPGKPSGGGWIRTVCEEHK